MIERVYDGALFCPCGCGCPVVDHNRETGEVTIHDPTKPENGRLKMSAGEYNALVQNAKPVAV